MHIKMLHMILSALTAALLLLTCSKGSAQTASQSPSDSPQEYLESHNQARAAVGVGPLRWSEALAKYASLRVTQQRDKQNCNFADLDNSRFGTNQQYDDYMTAPPRAVVEDWVAEKNFYDYENNTCAPEHLCGLYTQVVWKDSEALGCAQASCPNHLTTLTICFYNPSGNIPGEKPY